MGPALWSGGATPRVPPPQETYDELAEATAALVISSYSSSFGLAARLLGPSVRPHVRNIYALVRVADEIVDTPRPGAPLAHRAEALDALEDETLTAMGSGHSTNLVVHAFARTARSSAIGPELVRPFFASMRRDLDDRGHDAESFATYVHGSAEVVGLMCLRTFLLGTPDAAGRYDALAPGAGRLGAAFQKVNFLRDLGEDHRLLGRSYFPDLDPLRLDTARRDLLLDDVDADLDAAATVIPHLPRSSRVAVCTAHDLFRELSVRLRATPAPQIYHRRVRVPAPVKARLATAALARRGHPRSQS